MGMFDYVRCAYRLTGQPKLNARLTELVFQTKCFPPCGLNMYTVDADGILWCQLWLTDDAEYEKPFKVRYTGTINIVGQEEGRSVYSWYEFDLTFCDGRVTNIQRISTDAAI